MNHRQLSFEERYLIDTYWNCKKLSMSQIANELGQSKLTISRELKRNSREATYEYEKAQSKNYEEKETSFYLTYSNMKNLLIGLWSFTINIIVKSKHRG